jgi:hypothetical protein
MEKSVKKHVDFFKFCFFIFFPSTLMTFNNMFHTSCTFLEKLKFNITFLNIYKIGMIYYK